MEKKIYRIPQRLDRDYQWGGFTIPMFLLFLASLLGCIFLAAAGHRIALVVPAVFLVLHLKVPGDRRCVKQHLAIRLRYLRKDQSYGMQECERKAKK